MPSEELPPPLAAAVPQPAGPLERLILWYTRRAANYSNRRFIIEMLILSFLLKILGATPLLILGGAVTAGPSNTEQIAATEGIGFLIVAALVVAPPLETVLFQWFPIWICSLFTKKLSWIIGISTFLFALSHLPYGLSIFLAVFFPGVIFAISFIVKRRESRWRAFWVTSLIHAAHNSLAIAAFAVAG